MSDETLREKIEWLLDGGFLTNKTNNDFAYGLDLTTFMFFAISGRSTKAKNPKRITQDNELPLEDIHKNMIIYKQL